MLFINTRPADRSQSLTLALRAAQIDVLDLPLLELSAMPWSDQLQRQYEHLLSAQAVVAVSPSAVQFGMQGLARAGYAAQDLKHLQWIAVGEATAQALLEYGISSHVPEVETSEGMLRLPVLQHLQAADAVAFWRGEGGRQFMMDTLLARGNSVLNFVLYQRQCPERSAALLQQYLPKLQSADRYALLISSEASWNNWLKLTAADGNVLDHAHVLVLGERVKSLIEQYREAHGLHFGIWLLADLKKDTLLMQLDAVQRNT